MSRDGNDTQRPEAGSRRSFLGKLALGLTALVGAGLLVRNLLPSSGDEDQESAQFPGPDSIFHPRQDTRLEPQERRDRT